MGGGGMRMEEEAVEQKERMRVCRGGREKKEYYRLLHDKGGMEEEVQMLYRKRLP